MKKDRRSFILSTGLLAGAAVTGGITAREGGSSLLTPAEEVTRLVSGYGTVSVLGDDSSGAKRIQVSRIKHERMQTLLSGESELTFQQIKVMPRNHLEILHRGERIIIRHQS